MKNTELTPEQIEEKQYDKFLTRCYNADQKIQKERLKLMRAYGKLLKMQLEAMKEGVWLPESRISLNPTI